MKDLTPYLVVNLDVLNDASVGNDLGVINDLSVGGTGNVTGDLFVAGQQATFGSSCIGGNFTVETPYIPELRCVSTWRHNHRWRPHCNW